MSEPARCAWVPLDNALYVAYHDSEWGVPVHDDAALYERLALEGMQAGLSWLTILRKRDSFRAAFDGFDPVKVAAYGEDKIEALLQDANIIRNRQKIVAAIRNARVFLDVQAEFGAFDAYLWQFVGGKPLQPNRKSLADYPTETDESRAMSKDLKARGFSFIGPTTCYAMMQAAGLVNDHMVDCFRHAELNA